MAVKEIKDMGASVLSRLKKQARDTGINYQTCLQLFAQEEFLRKLEMSQYAENLILKGGMFLYTISNYEGRVLQEAIFETLQHRGTSYERDSLEKIKAFDQSEFLQNLWNNYDPGPGLEKPDFSAVLIQIERFLGPVYEAILQENECWGMWSSKENMWKR